MDFALLLCLSIATEGCVGDPCPL